MISLQYPAAATLVLTPLTAGFTLNNAVSPSSLTLRADGTPIMGPPGVSGGNYQHSQGFASMVWTVNHNLGYQPNVTTFDSENAEVEGDIAHVNSNQLTVTFSALITGRALCT